MLYLYNFCMDSLITRLALSAIGGMAIPLIYGYVSMAIVAYLRNEFLSRVLRVPIVWPVWIYNYFYPEPVDAGYPSNGWFVALYLGNFLLYSLLTYAFLSLRNIPKRLP